MSAPLTLGELREMTADLPDSAPCVLMVPNVPTDPEIDEDWKAVALDVQAAGLPKEVQFYADHRGSESGGYDPAPE